MPELPEVETIKRALETSGVVGLTITQAHVFWPRTVHALSTDKFCHRIAGQSVQALSRKGKYLIIHLSRHRLVIHLRMTGKLLLHRGEEQPYERVGLMLDDGRRLSFLDTRKFGRWYLVNDEREVLSNIGVEPLSADFTVEVLAKQMHNRSRAVKPFLLDQHYVAGLGNIYVDEALWEAGIHPLRAVNAISKQELKKLHRAIQIVLQQGIDHQGTSLGSGRTNYFSVEGQSGGHQYQLKVFRRQGAPCPRCQREITRMVVTQRGTHLCAHCQI